MDKLSYALGLSMGQNFLASGIKHIVIDDFAKALDAAMNKGETQMSYDEAKQVVTEFFTQLDKQLNEENITAGKRFLEENAKQDGVKVTASGLQYLVIKEGTGAKPGKDDAVTVHYTGRLIDGTVFDSSIERGEPATFGVGQVIAGWTEALQMMQEGAAWRLFIPSDLAYGSQGTGPIRPHSTLIFDVQLRKVEKH